MQDFESGFQVIDVNPAERLVFINQVPSVVLFQVAKGESPVQVWGQRSLFEYHLTIVLCDLVSDTAKDPLDRIVAHPRESRNCCSVQKKNAEIATYNQ